MSLICLDPVIEVITVIPRDSYISEGKIPSICWNPYHQKTKNIYASIAISWGNQIKIYELQEIKNQEYKVIPKYFYLSSR